MPTQKEGEPKKYSTKEIQQILGGETTSPVAPTVDQPIVIPEIQKDIEEMHAGIEKKGQLLYLTDEKRRLQKAKVLRRDNELLEEGRKRLGGFTGEDQLEKLQAQLKKDLIFDEAKRKVRLAKSEPDEVWLKPEEFEEVNINAEVEKEEKKRGSVLEQDVMPPLVPPEELKKIQDEYDEITKKLKIIGTKIIKHELEPEAILPLTNQQRQLGVRIRELKNLINKGPTMADKIASARAKAIEDLEAKRKTPAVEKPAETHQFQPHGVYDRGEYTGPSGGIGTGNIASVLGRRGGMTISNSGHRAGEETYTAPERTNEEALFDLDQDLLKKNTPEKLLQKLFHSEIYLGKEEHKNIILGDKTFLQTLDIEKWNGDLSVLKEVVGKLSLKKSDELEAIKHNKGWFKRLFETPEEKLLKKQMEALDDFAGKLVEGGKEGQTSPETKRLLRTMTKR